MKNTVGVHFREHNARICICDDYNIYTDTMELPMSIRNTDVLKDDRAFRLAFEKIRSHMQENMEISDFDVVLAIPDDYGLTEEKELKKRAKSCEVNLVGTCHESAALALYVNQEFRVEDGVTILSAFATDERTGIAVYEMGNAVKRLKTVLVTGQTEGMSVLAFLQKKGPQLLFLQDADAVFFTGSFNACMTFEQAASKALGKSGIEIKMLDEACIIEGLGYFCGILENRAVAGMTTLEDEITPYPLYISVNKEIVGTEGPLLQGKTCRTPGFRFTDPGSEGDRITIYEERKRKLIPVTLLYPGEEETGPLRRKEISALIKGLGKGTIELLLKTGSGEELTFTVDLSEDSAAPASREEDLGGFITNILPIIDNLEYAAKYAEDQSNPYAKGILQSYEKAVEILEQNGVTRITGEGRPFDFNLQNAVAHVADGDLPENTVKQVMQAGYMYQGKVLRTAQVIVAN